MIEAGRSNRLGGYRFLGREGRPFSDGAVADDGYTLVHAVLHTPQPLDIGLSAAFRHVTEAGRPVQAIAGFELRIPKPMSGDEFAAFNAGYVARLRAAGLEVDGLIPAARTNVAPLVGRVQEPCVYAVSYTVPRAGARGAYVMAGVPEEAPGDPAAMIDSIMGMLTARMKDIGAAWQEATEIQFYGREGPPDAIVDRVLDRAGSVAARGVRWFPSLPPIEGLSYEIDIRAAGTELVLA